jgi:hypothetical protein
MAESTTESRQKLINMSTEVAASLRHRNLTFKAALASNAARIPKRGRESYASPRGASADVPRLGRTQRCQMIFFKSARSDVKIRQNPPETINQIRQKSARN